MGYPWNSFGMALERPCDSLLTAWGWPSDGLGAALRHPGGSLGAARGQAVDGLDAGWIQAEDRLDTGWTYAEVGPRAGLLARLVGDCPLRNPHVRRGWSERCGASVFQGSRMSWRVHLRGTECLWASLWPSAAVVLSSVRGTVWSERIGCPSASVEFPLQDVQLGPSTFGCIGG